MSNLKVGDIVARRSYDYDILFRITDIIEGTNGETYILKGTNLRIIADAPITDLAKISGNKINQFNKAYSKKINQIVKRILIERSEDNIITDSKELGSMMRSTKFVGKPGKVLHLDGDGEYIEVCLKIYEQLDINAVGKIISEKDQPKVLKDLLIKHRPDILVMTGHDSILKDSDDFTNLNNYRHSKYFVEGVKIARRYEPSLDELVIFAGACQSHFESIIDAGANFASSPHRTLIHCLDPVFICERVAFTSVDKYIEIQDIIDNTITGVKGIGGFETRGKYRKGLPKSPYQ